MADYRIFPGINTSQIDGHTGRPADPNGWYYEPTDYKGDVLYSESYSTAKAARIAAQIDDEERDCNEHRQ